MENVITLGKLIGLLFLFCPPLLSIMFNENFKNTRNELAHPVMGTIFLVRMGSVINIHRLTASPFHPSKI